MKAPFKTFGDDAQPPPSISEDWTDMSTAHPGLASAIDSNANLPVVCPISLTARQARIAATAVDQMRFNGTTTIQKIATLTGTSHTTAGILLKQLANFGLVHTDSVAKSQGGRPARNLAISPKAGLVIGIDLRSNDLIIAAMTLAGNVITCQRAPITRSDANQRLEQLCSIIEDFTRPLIKSYGPLCAIGMSTTGIITPTGRVDRSDQVPVFDNFPLGHHLRMRFGVNVRIENDINCAAWGEFATRTQNGTLESNDDLLFVDLVEGLNTGLIMNGQLHRGRTYNAGEIMDALPGREQSDKPTRKQMLTDIVGPLALVVDPSTVVVSLPMSTNTQPEVRSCSEVTTVASWVAARGVRSMGQELSRTLPQGAPALNVEASLHGACAPTVGALALALEQADKRILAAHTTTYAPTSCAQLVPACQIPNPKERS